MNKVRYTLLIAVLFTMLTASLAEAQITITESYFTDRFGQSGTQTSFEAGTDGTPSTADSTTLQALADLTGDNQTWDFTSIDWQLLAEVTYAVIAPPTGQPGADDPRADGADHVLNYEGVVEEQAAVLWQYQEVSSTGLFNHGFYAEVEGADDQAWFYESPVLEIPLPLTMGVTWGPVTGTRELTFEGITITTEETTTGEVDGYGTLVTPAGSFACLRFKETVELTTTIMGLPPTTLTFHSINFVTTEGVFVNIGLNESDQVQSADYTVQDLEGGGGSGPTDAPSGLTPADGAVDRETTLDLSWGAVTDATAYDLQVATDDGFTTLVVDESGLTALEFSAGPLDLNTTYYWRVRGTNAEGDGPWSAVQSFTTANNVAVEPLDGGVPTRFELYPNYPNPFNPSTTLRFDLPEAGLVKLTVVDVLGRTVATLVNESLAPGRYEFDWDAAGQPGGLYLYRLETARSTATGSMVLLK